MSQRYWTFREIHMHPAPSVDLIHNNGSLFHFHLNPKCNDGVIQYLGGSIKYPGQTLTDNHLQ